MFKKLKNIIGKWWENNFKEKEYPDGFKIWLRSKKSRKF